MQVPREAGGWDLTGVFPCGSARLPAPTFRARPTYARTNVRGTRVREPPVRSLSDRYATPAPLRRARAGRSRRAPATRRPRQAGTCMYHRLSFSRPPPTCSYDTGTFARASRAERVRSSDILLRGLLIVTLPARSPGNVILLHSGAM